MIHVIVITRFHLTCAGQPHAVQRHRRRMWRTHRELPASGQLRGLLLLHGADITDLQFDPATKLTAEAAVTAAAASPSASLPTAASAASTGPFM